MDVELKGNPKGPLLVCVQGLMGDISDFGPFVEGWESYFHIVLPNIADHQDALEENYTSLDENGEKRLLYEKAPAMLAEYLTKKFPGQKAYFAGISLGGKITIEFAGNYASQFAGAVVTDVGIGPLCDSGFFTFVNEVLPNINLKQPWADLRNELKEKIPDRMLRLLIQMHIEVPDPDLPSANWREGSFGFPELVSGTRLENQWHLLEKIPAPIVVLRASDLSAISESDYNKMKDLGGPFYFENIPKSNHFIQVNHKDNFQDAVLHYLKSIEEQKPLEIKIYE